MTHGLSFGRKGEAIAVDYLKKNNYLVLDVNFRTRAGEIDIVGEKKGVIVFFEVKARTSDIKGKPYESVTFRKLRRLQKAIYYYLKVKNASASPLRIDVISIDLNSDGTCRRLQHFENVSLA